MRKAFVRKSIVGYMRKALLRITTSKRKAYLRKSWYIKTSTQNVKSIIAQAEVSITLVRRKA